MRSIAGKEGIEEKKGKEKRRAFCTALIFYSGSDPFGGVFLVASNVFCWHSWLFLLFFIKCQTPLFSLFFFPFSSTPARRFSFCLLKKSGRKNLRPLKWRHAYADIRILPRAERYFSFPPSYSAFL